VLATALGTSVSARDGNKMAEGNGAGPVSLKRLASALGTSAMDSEGNKIKEAINKPANPATIVEKVYLAETSVVLNKIES